MRSVQIILFLLPILISCQINNLEKKCYKIPCGNYKLNNEINKNKCKSITSIEDPFNNECVQKCDGACMRGYCEFCFCHTSDKDVITSAFLPECKRIVLSATCSEDRCDINPIRSCNSNYTLNPYTNDECLLRCDEDSCGKGGRCSQLGYCICNDGYRPDVTNPRICLKIAENTTTKLKRTCHKGFKLNQDGECVSTCGDCKNGYCGTDGVCKCWDDYELDVATSTCVPKMSCSDRCLSGVCDSDGVCQCPGCSDSINKTVNFQVHPNDAVYDVIDLDANYNWGNSSSSEDVISKTTHTTSITILIYMTFIIWTATVVLAFVVYTRKRDSRVNEGKAKILFEKFV